MRFNFDDVDPWYEHIKGILENDTYSNARPAEPEMFGDTKLLHVPVAFC